ncbi:hypothetical protein DYB30_003866 [Aphanomyces astaci]|uniref:Uncharacterized protein n=1 Tax=Aphanomyces astaci TaxID=112090 RepID=A0A397DM11_APHAT|nr:hypothetical protein DYB30_003866 [Aphanomyces astaci]
MNPTVCARGIEVLVLGFPVSAAMCDKESSLPIHYLSCNPSQTIDMTLKLQHYETFALRNRVLLLPAYPHAVDVIDAVGPLLSRLLSSVLTQFCQQSGQSPLHLLGANESVHLAMLVALTDPGRNAMKLPVHYIIENPGIPSDMAYRLLANGSAYRLRYDIQEVPHVPHACFTYYFNETISPATVYCAVDVALDSRTSKAVVLHYFSDRTTFQHLLTSLAQLDISSSDTTSVALVDSFDNARKRIRIEYVVPHDVARSLVVAHHVMNQPSRDASPILDFCLVLEHPAATVDEIRTQIDAQALMTSLGQCVSHWHTTAGLAHGNMVGRVQSSNQILV